LIVDDERAPISMVDSKLKSVANGKEWWQSWSKRFIGNPQNRQGPH
jgi:hypothetical protein